MSDASGVIAPSEPVAAPPAAVEPVAAPAASPAPAPAAPAAPPSVAPVAPAAPSPAPVADTAVAPAAGATETTPATEPTEPSVTPHTETPGLLSTGATEEKPAEATPTEPVAAPAPEPRKYEPLELPDGVSLNAETLTKFDEMLGTNQVAPELRQELANMHLAEAQRYAEHLAAEQHRIFGETRANWRKEIMADPELGGAGFQTNLAAAQRMLQMFVPPDRRAAMDQALIATGMADHPEFFRLMVNLAKFYDEPAPPPVAQKPPADIGRRNGAARRAEWYDHPRSNG